MARIDNESDDPPLGPQHAPRARPSAWRRPMLLAGIGLVLMFGGYQAMNYVPLTPRQAEQELRFAKLVEQAAKAREENSSDKGLSERLRSVSPPSWRTPPYQIPGRLAIFAGLFLFVAAGVLMYRHSPPDDKDEEREASAP